MSRKKDDQFMTEELGEWAALTRVGVEFSDSQKAQIQSIVELDRLTATVQITKPKYSSDIAGV